MNGTTVDPSGGSIALDFSGLAPSADFTAVQAEDGPDIAVPCFTAGTRIATPRGEIAIENLREGDLVLTAEGEAKPIVWMGRSRVDCRLHAKPEEVIPVRVRTGAFAHGTPGRDVVLSPGHAIFTDGVLIPVGRLINGISILREENAAEVTYYHVELPTHDILLAEGLSVESYLDDGNRAAFVDGAEHRVLHPVYTPQTWDNACAPMREAGPEVTALKLRLRARLEEWGYQLGMERRVEVLAGAESLTSHFARGGLQHFWVPAGVEDIRIVSPRGVPAGFLDESGDGRWLGAQLALLLLDGEWIPLDSPMLADGFYGVEQDASGRWRWTNGEAKLLLLPSNEPRLLELFVRDVMQHWERSASQLRQAA